MERFKRIAPYLLLGPISGLLVAGVVFNVKAGRPMLAAMYVTLLIQYVVLLPYVTAALGIRLL